MKRTALAIAIGVVCAGFTGLTLAQEESQNTASTDREMSQQQLNEVAETQRQDANSTNTEERKTGDTMDVNVEQEPADVQVQQEPANIKVEQSQPDITIEQPEPEVTIEQPEPNVTVEKAEPNVTVEQRGEPDVTVVQADDADVEVNRADDERQKDQAENQNRQTEQPSNQDNQGNTLMSHQVSDLEGMSVANQQGEEIGDIQHVARHNETNALFAIVSVGGIWGFGTTEVALSVQEMQLEGDQVVVNTDYGSEEIEDSSNEYQESDYTEVDSNMTLSDAQNAS